MKVFKFGGASIKNGSRIKNVVKIISENLNNHLVIVVSAIDKTTNALETILENKRMGNDTLAVKLLDDLMETHRAIIEELFVDNSIANKLAKQLSEGLTELLLESATGGYDESYDQWVSRGEMMSSTIIYYYLKSLGITSELYDARVIIRTNDTFREAKVDWAATKDNLTKNMDFSGESKVHIFQGFIGGTQDGRTTTLGREGSDFSAAILSYCLDVESMTIWKDVEGVLTADPRIFENVEKIERLSYKEAIEMTYYGAKVIHPKTIKPLQNKSIPLFVKPYSAPDSAGTQISDGIDQEYPPVVVIEKNQALLHISSTDFSFIAEDHLSQIFDIFTKNRIKVNMMRNSAISFSVCVSYRKDKMDATLSALNEEFNVVVDEHLELITIRHFSDSVVNELKKDKMILFEERLRNTLQLVVKDLPRMRRKA